MRMRAAAAALLAAAALSAGLHQHALGDGNPARDGGPADEYELAFEDLSGMLLGAWEDLDLRGVDPALDPPLIHGHPVLSAGFTPGTELFIGVATDYMDRSDLVADAFQRAYPGLAIRVGAVYVEAFDGWEDGPPHAGAWNRTIQDAGLTDLDLYDLLFPNATGVPDYAKRQVVNNMMNDVPEPLPVPAGQAELAEMVARIVPEIRNATDPDLRMQLHRELDLLHVRLLRTGAVLTEDYAGNRQVWMRVMDFYHGMSDLDAAALPAISHGGHPVGVVAVLDSQPAELGVAYAGAGPLRVHADRAAAGVPVSVMDAGNGTAVITVGPGMPPGDSLLWVGTGADVHAPLVVRVP
ncbi:MAG: hypothetical protein MPI93_02990 [Nitrosopumilus sp.]|nr:hypothetical protein [Nitrosopumilus sp.]